MTGHVVYVVTSEGRDIYSVMTRISAASLRISNRSYNVMVVCDTDSTAAMQRKRDPLLGEVNEWVTFETAAGDAAFRNRFLKTNLRNIIDGRYLFLDSDTLIRSDLSELFSSTADIACAANHSKHQLEHQMWEEDKAVLNAMEWQTRNDVYVNGGLMLCNDTPGARRFAADWHRRWLTCYQRTGRYRDQPALNAAIFATDTNLEILPPRFNAQIKMAPETAADAVVWHFYASANTRPITAFELLLDRVLRDDDFAPAEIESMIRQPHPWRTSCVDDYAAKIVGRKRYLDGSDYSWFRGNRLNSVVSKVRNFARGRL
jgi:Glycosyl transferase family 8